MLTMYQALLYVLKDYSVLMIILQHKFLTHSCKENTEARVLRSILKLQPKISPPFLQPPSFLQWKNGLRVRGYKENDEIVFGVMSEAIPHF